MVKSAPESSARAGASCALPSWPGTPYFEPGVRSPTHWNDRTGATAAAASVGERQEALRTQPVKRAGLDPRARDRDQAVAHHRRAQDVHLAAFDFVADLPGSGDAVARDLEPERTGEGLLTHWHDRQARRPPPQERVMVVLDFRRRAGAERHLLKAGGMGRVRDVEQRELRAEQPALTGRVLPDPEQEPVADRVQVGRVSLEVELPVHARSGGVAQVDDEERVDLPEGHDVRGAADEAHGVDALSAAQAPHAADLDQPPRLLGEHGHAA